MGIKVRQDAVLPGALLRQLEEIESEVQRVEFGELKFAEGAVVPLDIQNKPGIRSTTYRQMTAVGRFRLFRSYSTDVPMINSLVEEFTQPIHMYVGGYYLSDQDIEAFKVTGMALEAEDVVSVREAAQQQLNSLIALGSSETGTPGLLNHPDVPRSYSPVAFDATTTDADEIAGVIHDAATSIVTLTKRVEQPDTLFLPPTQYDYLATRRISEYVDTTILEQILSSSPYLQNAEPLIELEGAGPNGEDVAMVMRRDRRKVKAMVIEDFKWAPLERKGLGFERASYFRYAGIRLYRPYSVHLVMGI